MNIQRSPVALLVAQMIVGSVLVAAQSPSADHLKRLESHRKHIFIAVRLAQQANQEQLLSNTKSQPNPVHRVIYAYGLFRLSPKKNATAFTDSFPTSPSPDFNPWELGEAFPRQDEAPIFPGDKLPFSYWSINNALLSLAKSGNSAALRLWLSYAGGGGAEGIEGRLSDLADLFSTSPGVVVRNWDLFGECSSEIYLREEEPEHFARLRKKYLKLLPINHPFRVEILRVIDRLEGEAIQAKAKATAPNVVIVNGK